MTDPSQIDDLFRCSFCNQKFNKIIKFIPDCMSSICGDCYKTVMDDSIERHDFGCRACGKNHKIARKGLQDDKTLLNMIRSKRAERSKIEQGFRTQLKELRNHVTQIETLDTRERINSHFDQLELDICEAVQSAIEHIERIEKDLLKQMRDHRDELLSEKAAEAEGPLAAKKSRIKQLQSKQNEMLQELSAFLSEWDDDFDQASTVKTDDEVKAAQAKAQDYVNNIIELQNKMGIEFSKDNMMQYKTNELFLSDRGHLGELLFYDSNDEQAPMSVDHQISEDTQEEPLTEADFESKFLRVDFQL